MNENKNWTRSRRGGEEEEEFFNHYKNDLERHAHTQGSILEAPNFVAGV